MTVIPGIHPTQFDYSLPTERIAKYPLRERDMSRLLVYHKGKISETRFRKIGELLEQGDVLVVNNTRVIRARLFFFKPSGSRIEIFCLEPHDPPDYDRVFKQTGSVVWKCMVGNARKWKENTLSGNVEVQNENVVLRVARIEKTKGEILVHFSWDNPGITFGEILDAAGKVPLPPYLNREAEKDDVRAYQTLFARYQGSVAAPTAGLHFSDALISSLRSKVDFTEITLHVGAGTFKPVRHDNIRDHIMHTEHFEISGKTIETMRKSGNRVIAVGTTSVRSLESIAWLADRVATGEKIMPDEWHTRQWDPYQKKVILSREQVLDVILEYMYKHNLSRFQATTQLMIVPGYVFRMTDGIITNFHLPRSSLLMLVAAFIGDDWKKVYEYALNNDFRFLSYGDGSILLP